MEAAFMKRVVCYSAVIVCALVACVHAAGSSCGYPTPAYSGAGLQNLRTWEQEWVGKKITSANVDAVQQFLPESFYRLMKDTDTWGKTWFTIVAYQTIEPSPGTVAMTRKFCGEPALNPDGSLQNWTSGIPFPQTSNALEMAHNFRCRSYGDGYSSDEQGFLIDGAFTYDRRLRIKNQYIHFAGRTDAAPVPELPSNAKQLWRAFHMHQISPPEARNLRIIELQYKDETRAYDSWVWISALRRIRRRSTSERQDAQGGADFCGYDNIGWDGPVHINTYRSLGRREVLLCRHNDPQQLIHTPGKCLYDGTQRERINTHVLEVISRDPNFLYSKMIWYLDPETWQILYSDRYDRNGKLWKVLDQFGCTAPGYGSGLVNFFNGSQMIDVQRRHATAATVDYVFGTAPDPQIITLQYLQKHGY
jgi:hypothetical protein